MSACLASISLRSSLSLWVTVTSGASMNDGNAIFHHIDDTAEIFQVMNARSATKGLAKKATTE